MTITGTGLAHATAVRFGGIAGTILSDLGTRITVTSPPSTVTSAAITTDSGKQVTGTGAGTVDITVTTPAGSSKITATDRYTYTAPRPAVTGASRAAAAPRAGPRWPLPGPASPGHRRPLRQCRRDHHRRFEHADHRNHPARRWHRGHHCDHPGRQLEDHRRRPLHLHHTAGTSPVDLLHRSGVGDGGQLGGLVGGRRRLGQPGRVLR